MRVVLDANIFISSILNGQGFPARIIGAWREEVFDLLISKDIIEEVGRVLFYPRIVKRHKQSSDEITTFLKDLTYFSIIVEDTPTLSVIKDDPDDDKYLECAVGGEADYIVSGDEHLLQLRIFQDISILTPRRFWDVLQHS